MSRQDEIKELIRVYSRRLQRLKVQKAEYGISVDPKIPNEIEDIESELKQLKAELGRLKPSEVGTLRNFPTIFHNLPRPDHERFVGRREELKQIRNLLLPRTRHFVVTIDGVGGIGKTALALEVAYSYLRYYDQLPEEQQFDAIIWTTAKQTLLTSEGIIRRAQPLRTLDDIYSTIAITLEREDLTRAHPQKQDDLFRRVLAKMRTLLVIDNLETVDDERVLSFIREVPEPSKIIVTTRHRLDIAYPIRLTGMTRADALNLIAGKANQKGVTLKKDEAQRLYRRTGGVPLAIVWSLAQIGFGYSVDTILDRLGQPSSDITKFCFEETMNYVRGKPAYKLLIPLLWFSPNASRETLGYVAGLPELDRDDGLVELEKLSLINRIPVEFDHGNELRFGLPSLVKLYVKEEMVTLPDNFLRLLLENFSQWLAPAKDFRGLYWGWEDLTIDEYLGDTVLSFLDHLLMLIVHQANKEDRDDKFSDYLTIEFLQFIYYAILFLKSTGRRSEALALATQGCDIATLQANHQISAWLEIGIGWILAQQDRIDDALEHLNRGKNFYQSIDDRSGVELSNCYIGQALRRAKRHPEAERVIRDALEEASSQEVRSLAEFELGKLSRDRKHLQSAYEHHITAYSAIKLTTKWRSKMLTLAIGGNLGGLALELGRYDEAKTICREVLHDLETHVEVETKKWVRSATNLSSKLYLWLAIAEERLKEFEMASLHAHHALELSEVLEDQIGTNEASRLIKKISNQWKIQ
ncbi:MAG: AAA family ATPase [Anaerolineae bacterium]|nr:AAA family ATPase [Anaerolineae bacterium]